MELAERRILGAKVVHEGGALYYVGFDYVGFPAILENLHEARKKRLFRRAATVLPSVAPEGVADEIPAEGPVQFAPIRAAQHLAVLEVGRDADAGGPEHEIKV